MNYTKNFTLVFVSLFSVNIFAYIDPGTGSAIAAAIMALISGIYFYIKKFFYSIKKFFSKSAKKSG